MKLPVSWLKEYVDTHLSAQEIAEKLLSCGFEVEEIIYRGDTVESVVAGRIVKISPHPDADRLKVCKVDIGGGIINIVTGADNMREGDIVPVATDGSTVFGGKKISAGKLRGVLSEGMLCSGEELGITEVDYPGAETDGILILKPGVRPGEDMVKVLGLDEYVLDVSVTANRPDCQSIIGLAREVAAVTGTNFTPPRTDFTPGKFKTSDYVAVDVQEPELCPRYMAAAVKDIKIIPSPQYMQRRLRLCGLRPINAIVDITNYVLLEIGQPMHAFDFRRLSGKKITVRRARPGETLTTLNGQHNELTPDMLVICDDSIPEAVAGIMGGLGSGIQPDTDTVILESARFARDSIRKTSKKLGLRSDSSARFEKGVDFSGCEMGIMRALRLIDETGCGTVASDITDVLASSIAVRTVKAPVKSIDALLGIRVPHAEILRILSALNIKSTILDGVLNCQIPHYREDIEDYPDICEEIIRVYGYDKIVPTLLKNASVTDGGRTNNQRIAEKIRQVLEQDGFLETLTYSFVSADSAQKTAMTSEKGRMDFVKISNPLSENAAVMRTSMLGSMLSAAALNLNRKNLKARLFEVGRIYIGSRAHKLPKESDIVALCAYGEEDFFTFKGAVENLLNNFGIDADIKRSRRPYLHPGRGADVYIDGELCGYFGEVHPQVARQYDINIKERIYAAEIDFNALCGGARFYKGFNDIPKYPEIHRDLALVAGERVTNADIVAVMKSAGGNLLKQIELFDCYTGEHMEKGSKSMAYTLVLRDDFATLTSAVADKVIEGILTALKGIEVHLRT